VGYGCGATALTHPGNEHTLALGAHAAAHGGHFRSRRIQQGRVQRDRQAQARTRLADVRRLGLFENLEAERDFKVSFHAEVRHDPGGLSPLRPTWRQREPQSFRLKLNQLFGCPRCELPALRPCAAALEWLPVRLRIILGRNARLIGVLGFWRRCYLWILGQQKTCRHEKPKEKASSDGGQGFTPPRHAYKKAIPGWWHAAQKLRGSGHVHLELCLKKGTGQ